MRISMLKDGTIYQYDEETGVRAIDKAKAHKDQSVDNSVSRAEYNRQKQSEQYLLKTRQAQILEEKRRKEQNKKRKVKKILNKKALDFLGAESTQQQLVYDGLLQQREVGVSEPITDNYNMNIQVPSEADVKDLVESTAKIYDDVTKKLPVGGMNFTKEGFKIGDKTISWPVVIGVGYILKKIL